MSLINQMLNDLQKRKKPDAKTKPGSANLVNQMLSDLQQRDKIAAQTKLNSPRSNKIRPLYLPLALGGVVIILLCFVWWMADTQSDTMSGLKPEPQAKESRQVASIVPPKMIAPPEVVKEVSSTLSIAEREVEPAVAKAEPAVAKAEPAVAKAEPAVAKAEPAVAKAEPAVAKAEPAVAKAEPAVAKAEPAVAKAEPAVAKAEPVVAKAEPVVAKAEPVVTKAEPVVAKPAPVVAKAEPAVAKAEPAVAKAEPAVAKPAPVVAKPAPVVAKPAPAVAKPAPAVAKPAPAVAKAEPVIAKAAMQLSPDDLPGAILSHNPGAPETLATAAAPGSHKITPYGMAEKEYLEAQEAFAQSRDKQAVKFLQSALELYPGHLLAREQLIEVLGKQGKVDEVKSLLGQGLEIAPDYIVFKKRYAQLLVDQGDYEAAIKIMMQGGLPKVKDDQAAHVLMASLYQHLNEPFLTAQTYRNLLVYWPQTGVFWVGLGDALAAQGMAEDAVDCYQKALKTNSLHQGLNSYVKNRLSQMI